VPDHYTGLTENWNAGRIYCSHVTGCLIIHLLGVNPDLITVLPLDQPQDIEGTAASCLGVDREARTEEWEG
jgi:hypothetical protein